MIVRIGLFAQQTPEVADASQRNLLERFLPALREQAGFVAGYWGAAADGRSVSITIWESEEAMRLGAERANATPLLDWQDPALIASPERSDIFTITVTAEGSEN